MTPREGKNKQATRIGEIANSDAAQAYSPERANSRSTPASGINYRVVKPFQICDNKEASFNREVVT